jgi:type II secretory pathway component PulF
MTTDVDQQPAYQEQAVDKLIISTLQSLDKGRFGNKDKILFFKELSYLLHGGISITESMHII